MANGRRMSNYIGDININGWRISDPPTIKTEILNFFANHYKKVVWQRPKVTSLNFDQLSTDGITMLERPFCSEEVWIALRNCDGNKAPRPDGLNLNFIKANWGIMKKDFM
ncbi:hypothetical protein Dsin_021021 [Dipteronia sinensis]|uniref:Uncharacterized protein n=1 Tax=Dipteronia sinensis TaxID=43782 RepID=A0AAE0AAL2_9ROSI|nr:hypothetical protein Dsin_021021 [Dipteronia sinensis]